MPSILTDHTYSMPYCFFTILQPTSPDRIDLARVNQYNDTQYHFFKSEVGNIGQAKVQMQSFVS